MRQKRLDEILISGGFAKDKKEAFILVTEGKVLVGGQKAVSPAQSVKKESEILVRQEPRYVGRGAHKLEAAIKQFGIRVEGKVCADIGSATGGFTEILLKHDAAKVYAIDTARGKLALKLRENPKVVALEGKDIRKLDMLPEKIDIVVIDVSLIPLENILPSVKKLATPATKIITLFKPQYETRDRSILKRGVIKDDQARENLLKNFISWAKENSWEVKEWMESPIKGDKGNTEYLIYLASNKSE
ncbi:MAG: TlyA family RNA methyltransferase [bacterium]|nr:TlyA family RNA methyltransferase [bacterium]